MALAFFLALLAKSGFLDSEIVLILVGSSATLMVARAWDISSCSVCVCVEWCVCVE